MGCRKKLPSDKVPLRLLSMALDLLRSAESLPDLAMGGLCYVCQYCATNRPAVARMAVESGIFDLFAAQMRTMDPADRLVRRPCTSIVHLAAQCVFRHVCLRRASRVEEAASLLQFSTAR
eukprot:COSAG02_NODE_18289_length_947_cov_22.804245_2_plen_119_part_01